MQSKRKYKYDGPVMVFGRCVASHWRGETYAESETKARSNLTYQYKTQNNLIASAKVTLPGEVRTVSWKEMPA